VDFNVWGVEEHQAGLLVSLRSPLIVLGFYLLCLRGVEPLEQEGDVHVKEVGVVFAVPDGIDFEAWRRVFEALAELLVGCSGKAFVDDLAGFDMLEEEPDLAAVGVEGDFHGFAVLDFHGYVS